MFTKILYNNFKSSVLEQPKEDSQGLVLHSDHTMAHRLLLQQKRFLTTTGCTSSLIHYLKLPHCNLFLITQTKMQFQGTVLSENSRGRYVHIVAKVT